MDKTRAKHFARTLEGKTCSGWEIHDYINCGKSAIVLKAKKDDLAGAIKVFDPELIEKHGAEIQAQRISREKLLIGQSHPNLVQILDGGLWKERDLHFVVMEYLPWKNLADVLLEVPKGVERSLISQVASAAHFLEGLKICHRDIKPENIAVSNDFQKAKLLDLGVIRPHGTKPITDGTGGKIFVGTLKYSPPEFLLRTEIDSPVGWRALTFYQLGGVLHDLIMRRSLFSEYENPFAALVNAVQHTKPEIDSGSVSPALVDLAGHCLLKNPELRIQLVSWEDFAKEPDTTDAVADIKSRISRRHLAKSDSKNAQNAPKAASERLDEYSQNLVSICRLECIENRDFWPPIEIHPSTDGDVRRVIVAQFDPSATLDLHHHLRILFSLEWLDQEQDVIEVRVGASLSSCAFPKGSSADEKATSIFRGVYTADSVRRRVLPAFYRALELALKAKKLPRTDSTLHHLELTEEAK
ncbi:protein kinase [Oscillatoria laete-virens NRMC-F 0139]|nr:protein kinase [Oscillatoria laete-virens]MDL5054834.1 protein kinase [Oscillatoria laete-virens NRMC-F 0139]